MANPLPSTITPEVEARFWKLVDKTPGHGPEGECWVWTGVKKNRKAGYGGFSVNQTQRYAHRISMMIAMRGSIPDRMWVLHRCDNPSCVRPDHLRLGTHADNMKDCSEKGRTPGWPKSASEKTSKLSPKQVYEIRASLRPHRALAMVYGVSSKAIFNVKNRISYRDV